jgi:hypothetical protein
VLLRSVADQAPWPARVSTCNWCARAVMGLGGYGMTNLCERYLCLSHPLPSPPLSTQTRAARYRRRWRACASLSGPSAQSMSTATTMPKI